MKVQWNTYDRGQKWTEVIDLDIKEKPMKLVNFYEVMDKRGDVVWGGASEAEAVKWFRQEQGNALFVSVWNEEDIEEPVLVTDKIEISGLVLATIMDQMERARA